MGSRALQFPQAPVIMESRSITNVTVLCGRRYITSLSCQGEYLEEQHYN